MFKISTDMLLVKIVGVLSMLFFAFAIVYLFCLSYYCAECQKKLVPGTPYYKRIQGGPSSYFCSAKCLVVEEAKKNEHP